jgi:hypothetical protein
MIRPSRRDVLTGLGAAGLAGLWPRQARAFGATSEVDIAEIDLGTGTITRPNAWEHLLHEVELTTSVVTHPAPVRVTADSPDLFAHPFSVIAGSTEFTTPDDVALEQLGRYLAYGGFLLFDESSGADNSGFDRAVRALCQTLFPTRPLTVLPSDHSVYRSFFMIEHPVGRLDRHSFLEGVTVDGTEGKGGWTPIIYFRNDLSGALDRSPDGRYPNPCDPGGETQRREAVKLGINLILYSLTTDYKKDQAHVKALLESHRLDSDWDNP